MMLIENYLTFADIRIYLDLTTCSILVSLNSTDQVSPTVYDYLLVKERGM